MVKLNRRRTVKQAAAEWKRQYCHDGKWDHILDGSSEKTYQWILRQKSADAIDRKLPLGWTSEWCINCKSYIAPSMTFGEDDTYSSVTICHQCITKAAKLVSQ